MWCVCVCITYKLCNALNVHLFTKLRGLASPESYGLKYRKQSLPGGSCTIRYELLLEAITGINLTYATELCKHIFFNKPDKKTELYMLYGA